MCVQLPPRVWEWRSLSQQVDCDPEMFKHAAEYFAATFSSKASCNGTQAMSQCWLKVRYFHACLQRARPWGITAGRLLSAELDLRWIASSWIASSWRLVSASWWMHVYGVHPDGLLVDLRWIAS